MLYKELLEDVSYSGWYRDDLHDEYEGLMMLLSREERADQTFQLLLNYMLFCMPQNKTDEIDLASCIDEVIMRKLANHKSSAACA